jgi:[ribosomal protein S5]-alanine N-acetyltransferase
MQTERLFIREISAEDIPFIHELHSLPETDRYNTLGIPRSVQETEQLLFQWLSDHHTEPRMFYRFSIFLKETNAFIGLMGMNIKKANYRSGEIWYKFHVSYWKTGYATEAVNGLLEFAFETLDLHRVEAGCDVANKGSIGVLERVGMTREGRKRKVLPIRGEWHDNYMYGILEEDFRKNKKV